MARKKPTKLETFKALAQKARRTRDNMDIRNALRFGVENRISTKKIREFL